MFLRLHNTLWMAQWTKILSKDIALSKHSNTNFSTAMTNSDGQSYERLYQLSWYLLSLTSFICFYNLFRFCRISFLLLLYFICFNSIFLPFFSWDLDIFSIQPTSEDQSMSFGTFLKFESILIKRRRLNKNKAFQMYKILEYRNASILCFNISSTHSFPTKCRSASMFVNILIELWIVSNLNSKMILDYGKMADFTYSFWWFGGFNQNFIWTHSMQL